jgi:hypothetical protein
MKGKWLMKQLKTDDLALATTLRVRGFEPDRLELDGGTAHWVFTGDGDLHSTVRTYKASECLVEPRNYNRVLRETRQLLFKFLNEHGIKPKPSQRG